MNNQQRSWSISAMAMKDAWSGQWRREWIITKSQCCSQGKKLLFFPRISHIFLICISQIFLIFISQMFLVRICWISFSWPTSDLSCSRINFWRRKGQELGHAGCNLWICICEAAMPPLWSLSFLVWVVFLYWLFVFVKQHCLQTEFFVGADLL